ncbi:hypothetical protein [Rhodoblastus sp.]|uniref:hypothetical protein n=1 Tax=Rhodoblastus sp. TaxID=1962975 RepID=UPI003F94D65D
MDNLWTAAQPLLRGAMTLASVAGFAAALAAALPKSSGPGVYGFVRAVIDAFGCNFGNAKNAP